MASSRRARGAKRCARRGSDAMHYDHRAPVVRGLVLEIMVYAAAGQMISLSNAARLPVDDQDLPQVADVSKRRPGGPERIFMYPSACSSGPGFLADHGSAWISERAEYALPVDCEFAAAGRHRTASSGAVSPESLFCAGRPLRAASVLAAVTCGAWCFSGGCHGYVRRAVTVVSGPSRNATTTPRPPFSMTLSPPSGHN